MDRDDIEKLIDEKDISRHLEISKNISNFGAEVKATAKEVITLKEHVTKIETQITTSTSLGVWFAGIIGTLVLLIGSLMIYVFQDYKENDSARANKTENKVDDINDKVNEILSTLKAQNIMYLQGTSLVNATQNNE